MMRTSRLRVSRVDRSDSNRRTGFMQASKQMLGLLTENLELLLKLTPVCLLPPALILWWHLKTIHWSDIFLESALSVPGLIYLVVAAFLIWLLAVALFLIPSISIITLTDLLYEGRNVPAESMGASFGVFLGWVILTLIGFSYDFSLILFLVVPSIFAALFVVAAHLIHPSLFLGPKRFWAVLKIASQIVAMLVAMLVTAMLLVMTRKTIAALPDMNNKSQYLTHVLALVVSLFGLIPGFIYLQALVQRRSKQVANKAAFVGTLMVAYFVIAIGLFILPAGSIVLMAADVYSNEKFNYQIVNEDLVGVFVKAGLPVDNDKDLRVVSGFVRYNFGGVRLLCRDPFDPASTTASAIRAALDAGKPDPGKLGGAHCVPTAIADLRKFTMGNGEKSPD